MDIQKAALAVLNQLVLLYKTALDSLLKEMICLLKTPELHLNVTASW